MSADHQYCLGLRTRNLSTKKVKIKNVNENLKKNVENTKITLLIKFWNNLEKIGNMWKYSEDMRFTKEKKNYNSGRIYKKKRIKCW